MFNDNFFIGQIFNDFITNRIDDFIEIYTNRAIKTKNEMAPNGVSALQLIFKKNIFGAKEFLTIFRVGYDVCLSYTNANKSPECNDFKNSVEFNNDFKEISIGDEDYDETENALRYLGLGLSFPVSMTINFTNPGGYAFETSIILKNWSISM